MASFFIHLLKLLGPWNLKQFDFVEVIGELFLFMQRLEHLLRRRFLAVSDALQSGCLSLDKI